MNYYFTIKGDSKSGWNLMAYKHLKEKDSVTTYWSTPKEYVTLEEVQSAINELEKIDE